MDLTQLEYFRAVAKFENVTKAAIELYVSQPTLSQSISRLEDSLGVALFDRKGGKIRLNAAGQKFLVHVDNIFSELNTGLTEIREYAESRQNWVFIASSVIDIFKSIILEYREVCPDVHIDHALSHERAITQLLLQQKVDFAITPNPVTDPNINCVPLFEEEVFAVVGPEHPLANRSSATLDELRKCPIVCNSCDSDVKFIEHLFQTEYTNLDIIAVSSESHIPRDLTSKGFCVGFIPARVAVRHLKMADGDQKPIRLAPAFTRVNCISMRSSHQLSPAAAALYNYILDFCAKESAEVNAFIQEYYGE